MALLLEEIDREINADAIYPGVKIVSRLETSEGLISLHKTFLRQFVGAIVVSGHAIGEVIDPFHIFFNQLLESPAVAVLSLINQFLVHLSLRVGLVPSSYSKYNLGFSIF